MVKARRTISAAATWLRRQPPKVKACLAVVSGMAALGMLWFVVHDHDNLFVAAEAIHAVDISVLIYKLTKERTCAGVWWDMWGGNLPILQKLAVRILSQPCSSSACERNWSAFEAAHSKKRNNLAPERLRDLVFIRMNNMMKKTSKVESEDTIPIDLEKIIAFPDVEKDQTNEDNVDDIDEDGDTDASGNEDNRNEDVNAMGDSSEDFYRMLFSNIET